MSLAGCAAAPPPQPLQGEIMIGIERAGRVPDGAIYLKPVPGALLGPASGPALGSAVAGPLLLDSNRAARRLAPHAGRLSSDGMNPGELAEPRDLGVVRLGTFYAPANRITGCAGYSTSLITNSRHRSMLVYVDQPGSIRGSRYARPWIFEYDLEFPRAGVYLVSTRTRGIVVTQRVAPVDSTLVARVRGTHCERAMPELASAGTS